MIRVILFRYLKRKKQRKIKRNKVRNKLMQIINKKIEMN